MDQFTAVRSRFADRYQVGRDTAFMLNGKGGIHQLTDGRRYLLLHLFGRLGVSNRTSMVRADWWCTALVCLALIKVTNRGVQPTFESRHGKHSFRSELGRCACIGFQKLW